MPVRHVFLLGQFVNGQLGDKFGTRKLVFVGMIGSALLNIIFSLFTAFGFMMIHGGPSRQREKPVRLCVWSDSLKTS